MAEHTPGPWSYEPDDGSRDGMPGGSIIGSNGHVIASATSHGDGEYNQEQLATDLRLIAAAPAMLEALDEFIECAGFDDDPVRIQARQAIAQARGEAPHA